MLYFKRFIDDMFAIWIGNTTTDWDEFCADVNNFGILTWDIENNPPATSVDFLDLTLTLEGNRIVSKTFQKKMNLYLYLPAASAHPEGCIKGTVFGLVRRPEYPLQRLRPHHDVALLPPPREGVGSRVHSRPYPGRVRHRRREEEAHRWTT